MVKMEDVKRRVRKLKKLEQKIRWDGESIPGASLVWDRFFDLSGGGAGKSKYSFSMLSSMDREEYKSIVDEFFAYVYFEYYLENGIAGSSIYDPAALALLDLPFDSSEQDIKKRFRELAKKHHPDAGGNAADFIELMRVYEKLI